MLETPHIFVGAAIASKVPNPIAAISISFLSHFVLELVPHWNPHINTEMKAHGHITKQSMAIIIADAVLALVSGFIISLNPPGNTNPYVILACCFASILPDLVEAPYFIFHYKHKILATWLKWQKALQNDASPLPGLLTQLATIMAVVVWMYF